MPSKTEFYRQMADHVATQLTGSWQEWAGFLTTAARLYKYPFHEQLLIYAQRPDATACAEYDLWNEKMGRYVRRGSKGIALVDDSGDKPRLRYVFDITDTGTREHSRTPWLWKLEEQHIGPVSAMLERTYDVSGDGLAGQLTEVAGKLAEEYWTEHRQDFLYIVDDSFLEEYFSRGTTPIKRRWISSNANTALVGVPTLSPVQHTAAKITTGRDCIIKSRTARTSTSLGKRCPSGSPA